MSYHVLFLLSVIPNNVMQQILHYNKWMPRGERACKAVNVGTLLEDHNQLSPCLDSPVQQNVPPHEPVCHTPPPPRHTRTHTQREWELRHRVNLPIQPPISFLISRWHHRSLVGCPWVYPCVCLHVNFSTVPIIMAKRQKRSPTQWGHFDGRHNGLFNSGLVRVICSV